MHVVQLHDDILRNILSHLTDSCDILNALSTCKTFNIVAQSTMKYDAYKDEQVFLQKARDCTPDFVALVLYLQKRWDVFSSQQKTLLRNKFVIAWCLRKPRYISIRDCKKLNQMTRVLFDKETCVLMDINDLEI